MRLVDVRNIKSVATIYSHISQPMHVYHSVEEFIEHEAPHGAVGEFILITGMGDYYEFLHKNNINTDYDPDNKYINLMGYNLWIKTVDRFVPETADAQGNITYKNDGNGEPISTDGVYIRLYFITPTPSRHVLYTSSGLHTVGMSKWDMTGAQRYSFIQEKLPATKGEGYQLRLEKFLKTKKPTVRFIKLAMAMMVSDSDSFLNIDKAAKAAFGSSVKAADRIKLLSSPAFRSSLMSALKTLFPDLAPAIREKITPKEMADKLAKIYGLAEDSGDIEKMLRVFDKIKEVGYEEHTVVSDNRLLGNVPLIGDTQNQNANTLLELPNYTDMAQKAEEEAKKLEDELALRKEENDYPDSYVAPGVEDEKAEA